MKNLTMLSIGISFLIWGCGKNTFITISENLKTGNISFALDSGNFKIVEDEVSKTGSIFFETETGKNWIKGNPEFISQSKDNFEAKWKFKDREVQIIFKKDTGKYSFSFKAMPDSGILKWGLNIAASENEYFTGLFERTVDGDQKESWKKGIEETLNIRGQKIEMIIRPTLSLYCPFYISSKGYGLFIEGTWPGHYDMCKTRSNLVMIEFEGQSLSGIIYTSDNPAEIVKAHSLHVGPTIVPPKWAFLPWRWRDNHSNNKLYYDKMQVKAPYNSMLVEDILMMKAFDIPCGVYWVDRPWAKGVHGYEDFEWDPVRFPQAKEMVNWLHKNDIRFLLWIAPWVAGNMKSEANTKGYSLPLKARHGNIDSSNAALLDFTNAEACQWWQTNGIEKMLNQGIDGFKLDRSEELVPESMEIFTYDGRTSREVRNEYPVLYVKTVNESCKKIKQDDFVLIPRAGYTGSSKYSGFWGGDIGSPAEGLRAAIIALQKSALIGFPIWGSDIGGYWQGDLDREVCARWLAFGCFNPIMEFGPTEDRAPWDMKNSPAYDTELIAVWRLYAKIHTALQDYSYELAKEANQTGMPPARPLFLEYPDEKDAWIDWQTFKYGPDILISSVWEKGVKSQKCYLPKGVRWINAWNTDEVFEGGTIVETETPFHKIPIFIREGSDISLGNLQKLYEESLVIASVKPDLKELEKSAEF